MYTIKFKDDIPRTVSLGNRGMPANSYQVQHPDGTSIYIITQPNEKDAEDIIVLQSRFDLSVKTVRYLQYGYVEHILDVEDPDMFLLIMDDFGEWYKKL